MYSRQPKYRYICYSCVTGAAVWCYQGQSRQGMKRKYYRTVASERKRRQQYGKLAKTRTANIKALADECQAALPVIAQLTKEQCEAIKLLRQMADNPPEFCSPFLDHDRERRHQIRLEKRRRRYWKDAEYRSADKERKREARRQKRLEREATDRQTTEASL